MKSVSCDPWTCFRGFLLSLGLNLVIRSSAAAVLLPQGYDRAVQVSADDDVWNWNSSNYAHHQSVLAEPNYNVTALPPGTRSPSRNTTGKTVTTLPRTRVNGTTNRNNSLQAPFFTGNRTHNATAHGGPSVAGKGQNQLDKDALYYIALNKQLMAPYLLQLDLLFPTTKTTTGRPTTKSPGAPRKDEQKDFYSGPPQTQTIYIRSEYIALSTLQVKVIIISVLGTVMIALSFFVRRLCPRKNKTGVFVTESSDASGAVVHVIHGTRVRIIREPSTHPSAPKDDFPPTYAEVTDPNYGKPAQLNAVPPIRGEPAPGARTQTGRY